VKDITGFWFENMSFLSPVDNQRSLVGFKLPDGSSKYQNDQQFNPHFGIVTLWLFNIAMEAMAHRNRWFTYEKKWWIFPWRTVSHNQMVDAMLGITVTFHPSPTIDNLPRKHLPRPMTYFTFSCGFENSNTTSLKIVLTPSSSREFTMDLKEIQHIRRMS
jgi:hypothetical protein